VIQPLRSAFVTVVLLMALGAPLFAADAQPAAAAQYGPGDQTLSVNAGLFVPLFLLPSYELLLAPSSYGQPPHLSLGVVGSLSWAIYVAPQIRVGAELGGSASFSPNGNALLMLPILAKASYVFTIYPFEIPLTLGVGMNIVKYVDQSTIDLLIRPGASFYWIFNSSWSFGLNVNYWFDMQFATTAADSRAGNFLETTLTALYHY
jgi:hypothetical protein